MKPLVRSALAGLATGARSQSALAACARTPGRGGRLDRFLNRKRVRKSLTRSAAFELVTDKLPVTPARTAPPSVAARVTLGAVTGALVSSRSGGSGRAGALVGAAHLGGVDVRGPALPRGWRQRGPAATCPERRSRTRRRCCSRSGRPGRDADPGHRRRRLHRRQLRPAHRRAAPGRAGHGAGRAHLRGQRLQPGPGPRPDRARRGRHRRRRARRPAGRRDRPRRALRGRVAQRQLAARPRAVRADQPRRHVHDPRGRAPPRRAAAPHLHRRGLRRPRARRPGEVHAGDAVQPVQPVQRDEGGLGPAGARVGALVRSRGHDLELLEQLRARTSTSRSSSRARSPTC